MLLYNCSFLFYLDILSYAYNLHQDFPMFKKTQYTYMSQVGLKLPFKHLKKGDGI